MRRSASTPMSGSFKSQRLSSTATSTTKTTTTNADLRRTRRRRTRRRRSSSSPQYLMGRADAGVNNAMALAFVAFVVMSATMMPSTTTIVSAFQPASKSVGISSIGGMCDRPTFAHTCMPISSSRAYEISSMRKEGGARSAARGALRMGPLSEAAECATADISSSIAAGTNMLLAASSTAAASGLDLSELLYKAQSMASDMASSTGLFGGSGSADGGLTAASLAILYVAGLLTSFSPCSLSLLPLTVSYISASTTEQRNAADVDNAEGSASSLVPTLAFAAGLASVFVGLGLSVALLGAGVFGSTTQASEDGTLNVGKLVLAALSSGVSIAMGLQLLELVRIPLPSLELDVDSFIMSDDGEKSGAASADSDAMAGSEIGFDEDGNLVPVIMASESTTADPSPDESSSSASGSLLRTFLLGGSSALIASPCATPVLTSILAFVASSRNPIVGAILLFTYTLGYSTPLLVIGATGGQALANAQAAASAGGDDDGGWSMAKVGRLVSPLTASVLIWYGTTGFLEALIGDPSLVALAPILD